MTLKSLAKRVGVGVGRAKERYGTYKIKMRKKAEERRFEQRWKRRRELDTLKEEAEIASERLRVERAKASIAVEKEKIRKMRAKRVGEYFKGYGYKLSGPSWGGQQFGYGPKRRVKKVAKRRKRRRRR